MDTEIYPVYILQRVVAEIMAICQQACPCETLGRLIGYRCIWQQTPYVKIVDWVSGTLEASPVSATITPAGVREAELFLDERYGTNSVRPVEVGLFHSHPFGQEPFFSMVDHHTFLNFPYNQPGNVFVLTNPLADFFKVYVIDHTASAVQLRQVAWIQYTPCARF